MNASRCLVLGGARSGKSFWAEQRLASGPARYLATGYPEGDAEWAERVARHRARRADRWETVETLDVAEELGRNDPRPVLVDCLSLWLTRRLDLAGAWSTTPAGAADLVEPDVAELVAGRIFGDVLGTLNRRIAEQCDEVVLMVAGIPVPVKTPGDPLGGSQP